MLVNVLNICSDDELLSEATKAWTVTNAMAARKEVIRNKIRAIGKMAARFHRTARESDLCWSSRDLTPNGMLPTGCAQRRPRVACLALALPLTHHLTAVSSAAVALQSAPTRSAASRRPKAIDKVNERMPPRRDAPGGSGDASELKPRALGALCPGAQAKGGCSRRARGRFAAAAGAAVRGDEMSDAAGQQLPLRPRQHNFDGGANAYKTVKELRFLAEVMQSGSCEQSAPRNQQQQTAAAQVWERDNTQVWDGEARQMSGKQAGCGAHGKEVMRP
uniref:Uncharacterized protein n=1 Tax=Macrostomum lignano TaxID=282301 RepID=A0A1I8JPD5_9PLAT